MGGSLRAKPEPYIGPVFPFWRSRSVDGPPQSVWYDNFTPSDMVRPMPYGSVAPFFEPFAARYQGWSLPSGTAIDTTNCVDLPGSYRAVWADAATSPFYIAASGEPGKIIVLVPYGTIVTNLTGKNVLRNTTGYYVYFDYFKFGYLSNYVYYGDFEVAGFLQLTEDTSIAAYVNAFPMFRGKPFIANKIPWQYVQNGTTAASALPIKFSGLANLFMPQSWGFQDDTGGGSVADICSMHCTGYRFRVFEPISFSDDFLTVGVIP